jgi:hypothetical protein
MTKRKYKNLVDVVLLFLCIAPLIFCLFATINEANSINSLEYASIIQKFCISDELSDIIGDCIQTFGIAFNGDFYASACVIISNSLLIYIFYVFVAVLTFIPKMAKRLLDFSIGEK